MRICLIHYSGPPVIGGVEQTLYHHAKILADHGHQPLLLVGEGQSFDPRIPVTVIPTLYSKHPEVLAVKAALDSGQTEDRFDELRRSLLEHLGEAIAEVDVVVVHNALTLHKNLALTAALWDLVQIDLSAPVIGWHHDFAWDRPQYRAELHERFPWQLLRQPWSNVINVAVSRAQRDRLADLYDVSPESIHVIPPGIDLAISGNWTEKTKMLVAELGLLQADAILLLPARITPRKNIEFAMRILAELRDLSGQDIRLIVTGPPGPHNPANAAYLQSLLSLREELGLERAVNFIYQLDIADRLVLDEDTMANLYILSDALLFTSYQEGFGIPLLEAGFARLPIFCSDIPSFHESAGGQAHYFSLSDTPHRVATSIAEILLTDPSLLLRRRIRSRYTWTNIVHHKVLPLLESACDG